MKFLMLSPLDMLPVEPPHKPKTVESLYKLYTTTPREDIPNILPPVLVRAIEDRLLPLNGHHRTGMAYLFGADVPTVFIDAIEDLEEMYVLRDMGLLFKPTDDLPRMDEWFKMPRELSECRHICANHYKVKTFTDFGRMLENGIYFDIARENVPLLRTYTPYNGFSVRFADGLIRPVAETGNLQYLQRL